MPEPERRAIPLGWIVAAATTMLVIGAVVAGITAYRQIFNTPSGSFLMVYVPTPFGKIIFERNDVSFERAPKFSKRGIQDIQKHVERLMKSRKLSLNIYTDETESIGFALTPADPGIRIRFWPDPSFQPGVEAKLRSLFDELGEVPARVESDPSGFTMLDYRLDGSPDRIARVIERVLLDAYGVAPHAGLYFQFEDQ